MMINMKTQPADAPVGFSVNGILELAGGRAAVAQRLGLAVQTVSKWQERIPGVHARAVAIMAGLPLGVVRPDMVQENER